MKAQTIQLTLSDGTKLLFTGPAHALLSKDSSNLVVKIEVSEPFELPKGIVFEPLTPATTKANRMSREEVQSMADAEDDDEECEACDGLGYFGPPGSETECSKCNGCG
jgi:hypothetical protein